ncbi:TPA: hypothetical protein ACGJWH_006408, partial [Pseudomonas aeruginosa]
NARRSSRGNGFGRLMRSHTALIDAIAEITDNQGHTDKHEQRPRRLELEVMLSPIRNGLITAEVRLGVSMSYLQQ